MNIKEIQETCLKLIQDINKKLGIEHDPESSFKHLVEEVGEVSRELSKKQQGWREDFDKEKLAKELSDVITMTSIIASDNDIDLEEAFKNKHQELRKRFELD